MGGQPSSTTQPVYRWIQSRKSATHGQCDDRPTVTFVALEHRRPSNSTVLATEAGVRERLAQGRARQRSGWESNPRPGNRQPIPMDLLLTVTMLGWHVARHWAAGDGGWAGSLCYQDGVDFWASCFSSSSSGVHQNFCSPGYEDGTHCLAAVLRQPTISV